MDKKVESVETKVSDLIGQVLGDEMADMEKVSITPEELRALEQADRLRRQRKRIRRIAVAAAVFLGFGIMTYIAWPRIFPAADADKNKEHVVEQQDDGVIINDTNGTAEDLGKTEENVLTSWKGVEKYKKAHPELLVPSYVPDGYQFQKLVIETDATGEDEFAYRFQNDAESQLKIRQWGREDDATAFFAPDNEEIYVVDAIKVYVAKDQKKWSARLILKNQALILSGMLTKAELTKIIRGLR